MLIKALKHGGLAAAVCWALTQAGEGVTPPEPPPSLVTDSRPVEIKLLPLVLLPARHSRGVLARNNSDMKAKKAIFTILQLSHLSCESVPAEDTFIATCTLACEATKTADQAYLIATC